MDIIRYSKQNKVAWDNFVENSNNGTIFHLRKFLAYHKDRKFEDCSLIFRDKNKIQTVFSGAIIDNCLYSHPGASFGGFVYNNLSFKDAKLIIENLIHYAMNLQLSEIVIIPPPFVYYKTYNETMEYCLHISGIQVSEYYISSFVNVKNNLLRQMHSRKRRYIKKMADEIIIKESKNLDAFYPILIDNKLKHNASPTHSLKELKLLMDTFPNDIILLLSYKDNVVIGGSLIFVANQNSCILFYNMINYEYQDLQIASLQIYESLKWAQKNNLTYLDIGVSQLYKDDKIIPHDSLINFKEQFGAQAMIRKVMKLNL